VVQRRNCSGGIIDRASSADGVAFQALKKGRATNGHCVTHFDRIQAAHQLPCTSLAHAEDTLDGVAIEVFSVKPAQIWARMASSRACQKG
jgi:hypothetical protein